MTDDSEPYFNETYEQWHARTGELPPFYDPTKDLNAQHKFARATPDAVQRLKKKLFEEKEKQLMDEADAKAKLKAAMIMTGLMMLQPFMK